MRLVFRTEIELVGGALTSRGRGGLWFRGRLCLLVYVLVLKWLGDIRENVLHNRGVKRLRLRVSQGRCCVRCRLVGCCVAIYEW